MTARRAAADRSDKQSRLHISKVRSRRTEQRVKVLEKDVRLSQLAALLAPVQREAPPDLQNNTLVKSAETVAKRDQ